MDLSAVERILTQGIGAVRDVQLGRLQVSDPNANIVGPFGNVARVNQAGAGLTQAVGALAPLLVVGGLILGAVVLVRTLRK
jgi:hypothetical protein